MAEKEAVRMGQGVKAPATGKTVVFGNSDFLENQCSGILGNKEPFFNTVQLMAEDEPLVASRKKKPSQKESFPLYRSSLHSRMINIGRVILQRLLMLAMGIIIAWRRR